MNVLITGGNRGVGLELVKQFLGSGDTVFATCRDKEVATDLMTLACEQLFVIEMEVTNPHSIALAQLWVADKTDSLDLLINNAGVLYRPESLGSLDFEVMNHSFQVNAIAPMLVAEAFMPLLKNGSNPRLMSVTSQLGSLERMARKSGVLSYNASKAALNMYMRTLSHDIPEICVAVVHPGWVRTDMGGPSADISAQESADGIATVCRNLSLADTNKFFVYDGNEHAW